MLVYDIFFILLHISLALVVVMAVTVWGMKHKTQIHYVFLTLIVLLFIWSLGQLLEIYTRSIYGHTFIFFVDMYFLGLDFVPISFLFLGLIFAHTKLTFTPKYLWLFIPPCLSYLILLTNSYHHLFFIYYSPINTHVVYGKYFLIHTFFNYTYLLIAFYQLFYYSIKNSGFFSKQSLLIGVGAIIPFLVNILTTLQIVKMPSYCTPVVFFSTIIFYDLAILKYRFLNIIPIALGKVVNIMADGFIVVDKDLQVIDYNQSLVGLNILRVARNENLIAMLKAQAIITNFEAWQLMKGIRWVRSRQQTLHFEKKFSTKYFEIDLSPILTKQRYIGALFLVKDVTEHKNNLAMVQNTQKQLLERERLTSLGELAAGVAHDINSPLSAIQTNIHVLETYINKGQKEALALNLPSQCQVFEEMREACQVSAIACQKITQIVNSIRNHTRNTSVETVKEFLVQDIIKDVTILLHHHLQKSGCEIIVTGDENCTMKGDPGKLSQVLTNIIMNAIQAYDTKPGTIEINIQKRLQDILITVSDNAGGIAERYQAGIFKNILTTKGTQGTGLGLYISHAIITGHFRGDIWFETKDGVGTSFFIRIPV